jgi:hypothetical protein
MQASPPLRQAVRIVAQMWSATGARAMQHRIIMAFQGSPDDAIMMRYQYLLTLSGP